MQQTIGSYNGVRLRTLTDCRRLWGQYRAGLIDIDDLVRGNDELVLGVDTCGAMGTASTMACLAEAMDIMPLGSATTPAVSAARVRVAEKAGSVAVATTKEKLVPAQVLTREIIENAVTVSGRRFAERNRAPALLAGRQQNSHWSTSTRLDGARCSAT